MDKIIFLDRDGTLNFDKGHTYKVDDFKLMGLKASKILQNKGYKFIIVTNQAGRGLFSEKDYFKFRDYMHDKLKKKEYRFLRNIFARITKNTEPENIK
ncbi:hypothetical protein HY449_02485 [Candidatus Pacearchaeota archaeon]|nr:hypothetical protein [Candidatus Pacearchaeota archaeon]